MNNVHAALIGLSVACLSALTLTACASSPTHSPSLHGAEREGCQREPSAITGAPYRLELETDAGVPLPSFTRARRAYVMGAGGERYRIRFSNPTDSRVEVVVSVDGLDIIDGKPADMSKRGYVVGPHDEVILEGFRTSYEEVAAFRFSSVAEAYATRQGNDRNVGVIGAAVFPERNPKPPLPAPTPWGPPAKSSSANAASPKGRAAAELDRSAADRPGLGTEFGEARASQVSNTSFARAQPAAPSTVLEFRYNDRDGLQALGIDVDALACREDLALRESAQAFPARRFAAPPQR